MKQLSRRHIAAGFLTLMETRSRQEAILALAQMLIAERRTREADLILGEVARLTFERHGLLTASVVTARPITEALKMEIQACLKQLTGAKTLEMTQTTEPSLLGGFIATTPDYEIDMSLKRTLQSLETS